MNGYYDPDDNNHPVYINKDLDSKSKEVVYAHENQHRKCHLGKCFCWDCGTEFWCEYHAFRAEFKFALSKNTDKWWKLYFDGVIEDLKKFKRPKKGMATWPDHFKALVKVCHMKEFGAYANGYGYYTRIMDIIDRGIM